MIGLLAMLAAATDSEPYTPTHDPFYGSKEWVETVKTRYEKAQAYFACATDQLHYYLRLNEQAATIAGTVMRRCSTERDAFVSATYNSGSPNASADRRRENAEAYIKQIDDQLRDQLIDTVLTVRSDLPNDKINREP